VGAKANHALAEIAAGDDDVARIVAGRLDGGRERRFRRRPGLSLAGAVAQSIEARGHRGWQARRSDWQSQAAADRLNEARSGRPVTGHLGIARTALFMGPAYARRKT
jgi:hypothetical protein